MRKAKKFNKEKNKIKKQNKLLNKKMLYMHNNLHIINSLDVVVGSLNDFRTFCVYWLHLEWDIKVVRKYFGNLDDDQIMSNKEHMGNYPREMYEAGDDVVTPLCVKEFLDKGFSTMCGNLYSRFKPKDPHSVTKRLKKEREKALIELDKYKEKDLMHQMLDENFYIQEEHRTLFGELNVIYITIQDNYNVALSLIEDDKHRAYLKRVVTIMKKFMEDVLPEYLKHLHEHYKHQIEVVNRKEKRIKKKKVKVKKEYFILGEKVNQKRFKKELKFYIDREEYIVLNNEIKAV